MYTLLLLLLMMVVVVEGGEVRGGNAYAGHYVPALGVMGAVHV